MNKDIYITNKSTNYKILFSPRNLSMSIANKSRTVQA